MASDGISHNRMSFEEWERQQKDLLRRMEKAGDVALTFAKAANESLQTEVIAAIGTKHDTEKPAMAYIPPLAILEVGKAFAAGQKKYGAWNYMNGLSVTRCVAGALRHTFQFMSGETHDAETGVHHLACAVANLLMGLENIMRNVSNDDRFRSNEGEKK